MPDWEKSSTARVIPPARPRKLAKAPFVELADGRLQGVVSSGLRVEVTGGEPDADGITAAMSAARPAQGDTRAAAPIFSRFRRHLAYLELAPVTAPVPEMQWFPPTRETA